MDRGVKKIRWDSGLTYPKRSNAGTIVVVPDQYVFFTVAEWLPGTVAADKSKALTWMRQSADRKLIISQLTLPSDKKYGLKIPKKLCGDFSYYVEASLSGKRDPVGTGLQVRGYCPPKITTSKWSTKPGGSNIKNQTGIIKYGHVVHLNLETEGLNYQKLTVEVYNRVRLGFEDTRVGVYTGVACINGEVNLEIRNTFAWMAKIRNIRTDEDFYIMVKDPASGKYITDNLNQDKHAVYLKVHNEVVTTNVDGARNNKVAKVGSATTNPVRYEPCKFTAIKITEIQTDNGTATPTTTTVFTEGKVRMTGAQASTQDIHRFVFFDFDQFNIRSDAQTVLGNILQFLLEHPGATINLDAHADDRGSDDYNMKLSQKRADVIKQYFAKGGLDGTRIISVGHGERQLKVKGDHLTEAQHQQNRRTDIHFTFKGHGGNSIIYETVGPGVNLKKEIIMVVEGFDTKKCFTTKHTDKKVIFKDVGQELDKGDKQVTIKLDASNTIKQKVYSDLSRFNVYPIQYIWPKGTTPNAFWFYINSCRYYSEPQRPTVIVNVYPDIKWELAFEFQVGASNYKAANMPAGNIYKKHQEKAREAGYKRWLMNEQGKIPINIGVGLSAEWNNKQIKKSYTQEFEKKIETFAKIIAKAIGIAQNAVNYAQSVAKETAIPIGFDIRYPKLTVAGSWFLEAGDASGKVAVVGELNFGAKPLIGAEAVVDIIGCAITAISYGGTGSPAVAKIISKFRGGMEKLGASVTFTATFYGELEISFDALQIHSIKGMHMKGKTTIGGKMGVTIELSMEAEIGKIGGNTMHRILKFSALAKADASFGGDFVIDSDDKGLFVEPILKFSGLTLSAEVKGEIGWWKSSFKIEEKVLQEETYSLGKTYFV